MPEVTTGLKPARRQPWTVKLMWKMAQDYEAHLPHDYIPVFRFV